MKFKKEAPDEIMSLLGEGMEVVGEISFSHGLRVDGVIRGRIHSEGFLVIGAKGKVEAEMAIKKLSINGEFHGTIRASERVEIHKDGKAYGEIFTPCLIIEAGAIFEGKCSMSEQIAPKMTEQSPSNTADARSETHRISQ
jgi:cytoskeletal protein CcmA (bactofilin family)